MSMGEIGDSYTSFRPRAGSDGSAGRTDLLDSRHAPPSAPGGRKWVNVKRLGHDYRQQREDYGLGSRFARVVGGALATIVATVCTIGLWRPRAPRKLVESGWNGHQRVGEAVRTSPARETIAPQGPEETPGAFRARVKAAIYGPIRAGIDKRDYRIESSSSGSYGYILLPHESAVILVPRLKGSNTRWDVDNMKKMTVHYSSPEESENGDVISDAVDAIVLRKFAESAAMAGDKIMQKLEEIGPDGHNVPWLLYINVGDKKMALVPEDGRGNFDLEEGNNHFNIEIDEESWKSIEKIWKDDGKEKVERSDPSVDNSAGGEDGQEAVAAAAAPPPGDGGAGAAPPVRHITAAAAAAAAARTARPGGAPVAVPVAAAAVASDRLDERRGARRPAPSPVRGSGGPVAGGSSVARADRLGYGILDWAARGDLGLPPAAPGIVLPHEVPAVPAGFPPVAATPAGPIPADLLADLPPLPPAV